MNSHDTGIPVERGQEETRQDADKAEPVAGKMLYHSDGEVHWTFPRQPLSAKVSMVKAGIGSHSK